MNSRHLPLFARRVQDSVLGATQLRVVHLRAPRSRPWAVPRVPVRNFVECSELAVGPPTVQHIAVRLELQAQNWPCVIFCVEVFQVNIVPRVNVQVLRRHEDFSEWLLQLSSGTDSNT